jgi:hypothetical protein
MGHTACTVPQLPVEGCTLPLPLLKNYVKKRMHPEHILTTVSATNMKEFWKENHTTRTRWFFS